MEIRQLEYFIAVCDCKSFTRASEKLFVSQPAITMAIASLENELGIKLFMRNKRNVVCTVEGKVFYNYVQHVLGEINHARVQMDMLKAQSNRVIKIAVSPLIYESFFLPMYHEFIDSHRKTSVEFEECERERALRLLNESGFDFAILAGSSNEFNTPSVVIRTGFMRLAARQPRSGRLSGLRASKLILVHDGDNSFNSEVIEAIGKHHIVVQKLLAARDLSELLDENSVAILPDWIPVSDDLHTVCVEPRTEASVLVLCNQNIESDVSSDFLDFLVKCYSKQF